MLTDPSNNNSPSSQPQQQGGSPLSQAGKLALLRRQTNANTVARMDKVKRELYVTSKHRSQGQVDWSRQLSRTVEPYFVPRPTANNRGATYDAERPRPHQLSVNMEKGQSRSSKLPTAVDVRAYEPKTYEDIHKPCPVNIGKAMPRDSAFGKRHHNSEVVVDPFDGEGWGKGKKSAMARAPRSSQFADVPTSALSAAGRGGGGSPTGGGAAGSGFGGTGSSPTLNPDGTLGGNSEGSPDRARRDGVSRDASPFQDTGVQYVESRMKKPLGGTFGKCLARPPPVDPGYPDIKPNLDAVKANRQKISLNAYSGRPDPEQKLSAKYRKLFKTPPPKPMEIPEKRRVTHGFAPQRWSFRDDVETILAVADMDARRARSVMDITFRRSFSPLRQQHIYTPSPSQHMFGSSGSGAQRTAAEEEDDARREREFGSGVRSATTPVLS